MGKQEDAPHYIEDLQAQVLDIIHLQAWLSASQTMSLVWFSAHLTIFQLAHNTMVKTYTTSMPGSAFPENPPAQEPTLELSADPDV